MKAPLKWLKEYVDIKLPPAELAEKLTMAGLETMVTSTNILSWDNIFVGQVMAINPHPNADRLRLPKIDLGTEQIDAVCGAPNLTVGDKIVFARVGAEVIEPYKGQLVRLEPAKIRGVVSTGMVCSEKELGISESHEGIMVLPPDAPVGTPLADYLGDIVLDLDVTPNRPDCLSVIGIAREIAALTGQNTHIAEASYEESEPAIDRQVSIEIADADLCPRYCATLITGIKIADSPAWMQERLLACGMRPINNIVDVTNYVMLEYGQPLHSFDYDKIIGKKIIVRRATEGEAITSLDNTDRTLTGNMLVIADEKRAVAIAGVMGGANSEVTDETTNILLESANFKPASIHYTGSKLMLPSEACMRFERGIRPELTIPALKRATQLLVQLADGKAAAGIADVYPGKKEREAILLSAEKVNRLLDVDFSIEQITEALTSLGFDCKPTEKASEIRVTAPYWRSDISQAVDLVEEAARIIGYDKIPTTLLGEPIPHQTPPLILNIRRKIRESLVGYGFQEIVTFSLNGLEALGKLKPESQATEQPLLRLFNPMTADQEYLRPNLRVNILNAFAANRRHEDSGIRLFELGKTYIPQQNDLPEEPEVLCVLLGGPRLNEWWQSEDGTMDFFDAKGIVEGLLNRLELEASFEKGDDESLHPAKQAAIIIEGNKLGVVGELHPKVAGAFDIAEPVYLLELDLTTLLPHTTSHGMFQPIPRFPATVRDIALVVDTETTSQQIVDTIRSFPLVSEVNIFDVYHGQQVPPGKKSYAYRIMFRSPDHTLTDKEADRVYRQILGKLTHQLGATLRG